MDGISCTIDLVKLYNFTYTFFLSSHSRDNWVCGLKSNRNRSSNYISTFLGHHQQDNPAMYYYSTQVIGSKNNDNGTNVKLIGALETSNSHLMQI
jgi:hypothetical protein